MQKTIRYLVNLTPLRGIAALLTVLFHLDLTLGSGGDCLIRFKDSMILSRMYLMVDFFFILSGFIMCHVYSKWFAEAITGTQFKKFTIARFARIYPMHLVTLIYTIILFYISSLLQIPKVPVLQIADNGYSVLTNLLLLHSMNLHNWFSWNHASWSISTEWWAYMVFPFLVKPIMKLKPSGIIIVIALCFIGYLGITYYIIPIITVPPELSFVKINPAALSLNAAYQFGFLRCLCGFTLGMAMYQCYKAGWGSKLLSNGYAMAIIAFSIFTSMHFALPDFVTVTLFPLLLLSGTYGSTGIDKLFGIKPLQMLGDWSFSIYLVHEPLLYTMGSITAYLHPAGKGLQFGPPPKPDMPVAWLISLGFVGVTLLISSLTYRFIEVPARNWINRRKKNKQSGIIQTVSNTG
ncbi:acyltransferase [Mucilaginibacter sp. RB4R14]|uniref:acyltransferase family protein n=1 Tax=Mucilaginibacter aurantiaciroseus TaxID=2949308 RepID=UPI002091B349|nr:acyltransferase [Mucilaginibacter aurantiaciroseus]MCO5935901.1 acyltransferase [Mucilaginibacter aurantiaciroseus]